MELKQVQISDSLEDLARIGVIMFRQVSNGPMSTVLRQRMDDFAAELRHSMADRRPSELDTVARTRKLYRLVGVDPTKDRPSSEKLLRRVMQERPLPKVNKLVDAMNLVSLREQCPIGIYDWDRVVPPVIVRIGRPDEGYIGLSDNRVSLEGRLSIGDGEGLFGNPSHDSARTMVTRETVRAFAVAWAPAEAPRSYLETVLAEIQHHAEEFCEARVSELGIL
jgi:DNA/RNA-binding domain of Phe-tRNA-synthetase-like protein